MKQRDGSDILQDKITDGNVETGNVFVDTIVELTRLSATMDDYLDKQLETFDISRSAFRMLLSLGSRGGTMTPTDLSKWLRRSKNAVSALITTLSKKGLVERSIDKNDLRSLVVTLNAKGLKLLRDVYQDRLQFAGNILSPLELGQVQQLKANLRDIRKHLE